MTIKCKFYDEIGDCTPHPVCKNQWIKGKAQSAIPFSDGFIPECPFKNTDAARVYCVKYESSVKYRITNGEIKLHGPFDSIDEAQRFIRDLKIEDYE